MTVNNIYTHTKKSMIRVHTPFVSSTVDIFFYLFTVCDVYALIP